jgi:hypothetical protein
VQKPVNLPAHHRLLADILRRTTAVGKIDRVYGIALQGLLLSCYEFRTKLNFSLTTPSSWAYCGARNILEWMSLSSTRLCANPCRYT